MTKRVVGAMLAGILLLVGGIAWAADGVDRPTVTEAPSVSSDSSDASDDEASDDESQSESESDADADEASDTVHPDNHGADVSSAAHECPKGQEAKDAGTTHGECVSEVARDHDGEGEADSHGNSEGKGKGKGKKDK